MAEPGWSTGPALATGSSGLASPVTMSDDDGGPGPQLSPGEPASPHRPGPRNAHSWPRRFARSTAADELGGGRPDPGEYLAGDRSASDHAIGAGPSSVSDVTRATAVTFPNVSST
jgi:hypothetical protein